jgi:hypothetical protein
MPLRLKPVARSLSVRAEFFGLELEDWGLVIAWAILMRLIGDHIHRVLLGFLPVSNDHHLWLICRPDPASAMGKARQTAWLSDRLGPTPISSESAQRTIE